MYTRIVRVDPEDPRRDIETIAEAAEVIGRGGLVAFPTETVYGLGADAFNSKAVLKIFAAKGRPADNPLIVHIADWEGLGRIAAEVPPKGRALIDAFWPGPLTLILPKAAGIPDAVSGGRPTVGVRMPANPVARALIRLSGTPIAAPSANASTKPSPTRASHVEYDMKGRIDMIIDGGPSEYGLESTIVDVTVEPPRLLRPGSITLEMLREAVGPVDYEPGAGETEGAPIAPGMKYRHYSPQAEIIIVRGERECVARAANAMTGQNPEKTGVITSRQNAPLYESENVLIIGDEDDPAGIAANLFKTLRRCDFLGLETAYCEDFSRNAFGMAIMNRLNKAAGYRVLDADGQ